MKLWNITLNGESLGGGVGGRVGGGRLMCEKVECVWCVYAWCVCMCVCVCVHMSKLQPRTHPSVCCLQWEGLETLSHAVMYQDIRWTSEGVTLYSRGAALWTRETLPRRPDVDLSVIVEHFSMVYGGGRLKYTWENDHFHFVVFQGMCHSSRHPLEIQVPQCVCEALHETFPCISAASDNTGVRRPGYCRQQTLQATNTGMRRPGYCRQQTLQATNTGMRRPGYCRQLAWVWGYQHKLYNYHNYLES